MMVQWLLLLPALILLRHLVGVVVGLIAQALERREKATYNSRILSVVFRETVARSMFSLLTPLAFRRAPPRPRPHDPLPAVLLVRGAPWSLASMSLLEVYLRQRGFQRVWTAPVARRDMELEDRAKELTAVVERFCTESEADQIDIVAHGLGGVVAAWSLTHGLLNGRVRRLITLGTPWKGTRTAVFLHDSVASGAQPGAHHLDGLLPPVVPNLSIWCPEDPFVVPAESARASEANSVAIDGAGHVGLLASARAFRAVQTALVHPLPEAPH